MSYIINSMFHYVSSGLDYIWLKNGFTVKEIAGEEAISIHNLESLHEVIATELAKNKPELTGAEFRFLRKELDWSQANLAQLLGVNESTLRNWENDRNAITSSAERMLRGLYLEAIGGDGTLLEIVEHIAHLNRIEHEYKLELVETDDGWQSAA